MNSLRFASKDLTIFNMDNGWIKLHRKIIEHWIFADPNYFRAWIIMLINVNYEDKKTLINGQVVECKRGQSVLSIDSWVNLFGISKKKGSWSYQKVRTFFELLQSDGMIIKENIVKSTRITICNYESYQNTQQPLNNQITTKQQPLNNRLTTTKESKESKEVKEIKNIPAFLDFKTYALENDKFIDLYKLELKYKAWVEAGWKDGNGKPIKNWKAKLLNTIPYLQKHNNLSHLTQAAKKDSDF